MSDFFITFAALLLTGIIISLFNYFLNLGLQTHIKNIEQLERHCEKIRSLFGAQSEGEKVDGAISTHINILLMFIGSLRLRPSLSRQIRRQLSSLMTGGFGTLSDADKAERSGNAVILIYSIQIEIQNYLRMPWHRRLWG